MSTNKTKPSSADVMAFLDAVEPARRREDGLVLHQLMNTVTGMKPALWTPGIVGYGQYAYKYASGREGLWPITGFSPRKASMSIYIMPGFKQYTDQLSRLGKLKHSVSCLYISRLDQTDLTALEEIISDSVRRMKEIYPVWQDYPDMA